MGRSLEADGTGSGKGGYRDEDVRYLQTAGIRSGDRLRMKRGGDGGGGRGECVNETEGSEHVGPTHREPERLGK